MCSINCSGGCPECAPDEHAFDKWWEEENDDSMCYESARKAFIRAWHLSSQYHECEDFTDAA